MSSGDWSKTAKKWHEPLRRVIAEYKTAELSTEQIRVLSERIPDVGNNVQFIPKTGGF